MELIVPVIPLYHAGVGYAALVNAAWLNIYYIVILAWCMFYLLVSLNTRKSDINNYDTWICSSYRRALMVVTVKLPKHFTYNALAPLESLFVFHFRPHELSKLRTSKCTSTTKKKTKRKEERKKMIPSGIDSSYFILHSSWLTVWTVYNESRFTMFIRPTYLDIGNTSFSV